MEPTRCPKCNEIVTPADDLIREWHKECAQLPKDFAAELRERADSYRAGGPSSEHTATMLEGAAEEIERLRSELADVRALLGPAPRR